MKNLAIYTFLLAICAPLLSADLTVKDYLKRYNGEAGPIMLAASDAYLLGLGSGLQWADTRLVLLNRQPLFCMPEALRLGADNYKDIIDRQIEKLSKTRKKEALDALDVGFILLKAFIETFPCSRQDSARRRSLVPPACSRRAGGNRLATRGAKEPRRTGRQIDA